MKKIGNETHTPTELDVALQNFRKAFLNLNTQWDKASDEEQEELHKNYPFKQSFDELTLEVLDWVDGAGAVTDPIDGDEIQVK